MPHVSRHPARKVEPNKYGNLIVVLFGGHPVAVFNKLSDADEFIKNADTRLSVVTVAAAWQPSIEYSKGWRRVE
jgi:hypothetical protein